MRKGYTAVTIIMVFAVLGIATMMVFSPGVKAPGPTCTRGYTYEECTGTTHSLTVFGLTQYYNEATHQWETIDRSFQSTGLPSGYNWGITKNVYTAFFKSNSRASDLVNFTMNKTTTTLTPGPLYWRNDILDEQQVGITQNVDGAPNGDAFTYDNAYGAGIALSYNIYTETLKESIELQNYSLIPTPTINLSNETMPTFDIDFVVHTGADDIRMNDIVWDGITRNRTKEEIYFTNADGKVVYHLIKPVAHDSSGSVVELEYEVRLNGSNIVFSIKTPYWWLSHVNRTYPITIDPTLTVDATTTAIYGNNTYDTITVKNGGKLKVSAYDGSWTSGKGYANITATQSITVDSTSSIDAIGSGFYGGCQVSYPTYDSGPMPVGQGGNSSIGHAGNDGPYGGMCNYCPCGQCYNNYWMSSGGGGGGFGSFGPNGYGSNGQGCGRSGGGSGTGGSAYGTSSSIWGSSGTLFDLGGGAGGGGISNYNSGGGGCGGNGGGAIYIEAPLVWINGTVTANGGAGGNSTSACCGAIGGPGGGAGGGNIIIKGTYVNISYATISAKGGMGGLRNPTVNGSGILVDGCSTDNAGGGAGGRVKIFYGVLYNTSTTVTVANGSYLVYGPQASAGGPGTVYYENTNVPPSVFNSSINNLQVADALTDLSCIANLTDTTEDPLNAYFVWWKNNTVILSGNKSVTRNASTTISVIRAGNLTQHDNWTCQVTPNDFLLNGTIVNTSSYITEIPNDLQFIAPTFSNATTTINATISTKVGTNASLVSSCIMEYTNATGTANLTMSVQDGVVGGYDACFLTVAQNKDYLVSFRVWAANVLGHAAYSPYRFVNIRRTPYDMQFISPTFANGTTTTNATIYVNIADNSSLTSACVLEFTNATGTVNLSMSVQAGSVGGNDSAFVIINQVKDANITFRAFCNNTYGEGNYTGYRTIKIARTPYDIQFIAPTFPDGTVTDNTTVFVNITSNSSITSACVLEFSNASGVSNLSMVKQVGAVAGKDSASVVISQNSDFLLTFRAFCNNTYGEGNYSALRSVKIARTPTDITFISPTYPNDTMTNNATFYINVSTNSSSTDKCFLEFTNASGTVNISMQVQQGSIGPYGSASAVFSQSSDYLVYFRAWCNSTFDGSGNYSEKHFYDVNRVKPVIQLVSPDNGSVLIGQWAVINLTISGSSAALDSVWIQNETMNTTITNHTGTSYYINTSMFAIDERNMSFIVWTNDTVNNIQELLLQYALDKTKPFYWNLIPGTNVSTTFGGGGASYTFFASWRDLEGPGFYGVMNINVTMEFYSSANLSNKVNYSVGFVSGNDYSKTFIGLAAGTYFFRWCAADSVNATNCTALFQYDITTPVTPPAGGGGGGGGGGGFCGNSVCEYPESATTCPRDCANISFSVNPTIFNNPASAGANIICLGETDGCYIEINNPNPSAITVNAKIEKVQDESNTWAKFVASKTQDLTITVPAESAQRVGVAVSVPDNLDFNGVKQFRISFNSGEVKYVDYYLTFGGVIGVINTVVQPLFGQIKLGNISIYGYQVLFIIIIIIIVLAFIYNRGQTKRRKT